MKILVFSDTHGETDKMYELINENKHNTDLVIHLGDCWRDIDSIRHRFPEVAFLGVCGNCDYLSSNAYPHSNRITLEGHTFYFTHGHMQAIKTHGYSLIFAEARRAGADIILHGHTHVGLLKEENGFTVFNPGSLSKPRDYTQGSYGVINVSDGKCRFEIVKL